MLDDTALGRLGYLNLIEFSREVARWSGRHGAVEERDGLLLYSTAATFPVLMNGAFRIDRRLAARDAIEMADAWFGARGRGYSMRIGPDDADLVDAAEAAGGFTLMDGGPEMVIRAPAPVPERPGAAGAQLRWVVDEAGMRDFTTVNGQAFSTYGMPPEVVAETILDADAFLAPHVHSVVAYLDGAPMAAAQTILSHGIAGVYWVGTVASARGKGLGEAVTAAVTNRAFELGSPVNTLQASPMGEAIYRRMGYEELYRVRSVVRFTPPGQD